MQKKLLIVSTLMIFVLKNYGQDSTLEVSKADSMALDDLMSLLDSGDASISYTSISAGVSNRLFSIRNNALNSKETSSGKIIYAASAGYFHKSGLSITTGVNMLNDINGLKPNQYSVTPAYDFLTGKKIAFGISYSHYFIKDKYSTYASPIQNDVYSYIYYKNKIIQPGIAAGFSSGNFTEITKFTLPLIDREFIDTGTYKVKSFSLIASINHNFDWYSLFGKEDGFSFTPTLQVNFSSDSTETVSHTIGRGLLRNLKRLRRLSKFQGKNDFAAQSVALNLDFNYSAGKFSFAPQVYLDYYLPATEEKRFTQLYAFTIGYSF